MTLDEAEQVRLDEQEPLHHDRARYALEAVGGLDREDVAVVEEVGDLVRVAGDPVRDAVQPVLELPAAAQQAPAAEQLAARQRDRDGLLSTPVGVDDLAGGGLEALSQLHEPLPDSLAGG